MPQVTQTLILANVLVFLVQMVAGDAIVTQFALWPIGPQFAPWQLVSYAFLHGSFAHILWRLGS